VYGRGAYVGVRELVADHMLETMADSRIVVAYYVTCRGWKERTL